MRGENCPIANCTTTMVIVSTSVANDTIDAAIVVRIAIAASGPPVSQRGIASKPVARSMASVMSDNSSPANTHMTGINQTLAHTPERRDELMARRYPMRPPGKRSIDETMPRSSGIGAPTTPKGDGGGAGAAVVGSRSRGAGRPLRRLGSNEDFVVLDPSAAATERPP